MVRVFVGAGGSVRVCVVVGVACVHVSWWEAHGLKCPARRSFISIREVVYPADVGGHTWLRPQPLDQALEEGSQVDLVDGSLREQVTDPADRPGSGVSDHNARVLHQLDQGGHRLQDTAAQCEVKMSRD